MTDSSAHGTVKVFDCYEWSKTGDIGDNSKFWKDAIILNERKDQYNSTLVDVKFIDSGRISKGHFKSGVSHGK